MTVEKIISIPDQYWLNFKIQRSDLELLYNHLLELETPQTTQELVFALITARIEQQKKHLKKDLDRKDQYLPKNVYKIGAEIVFPLFDNKKAKVISTRPGSNPQYSSFSVIEVEFDDQYRRFFASGLDDHVLNMPPMLNDQDPNIQPDMVMKNFGKLIASSLKDELETNPDLILIAGRWFPRSLLVKVNAGHLNLAEAFLEEAGGGPLPTHAIIEQVELPKNVNPKLIDFSLDLALQEDERFDEVGPTGQTLWFLKRLEPEPVQHVSPYLKYSPIPFDAEKVKDLLSLFVQGSCDELEPGLDPREEIQEDTIALLFPHWRAGTLPLTNRLKWLLPTATEAPRIRFLFVDTETGEKFPAWVVQPFLYVFGLSEWYQKQNLIPGSLIHLRRGGIAGEVELFVEKRKQSKEWMRTVLIGSDGGIVFAMLKQPIFTAFDERLTLSTPNVNELDVFWLKDRGQKENLSSLIIRVLRELSKLNPQGHVHAQELYAAINVIKRVPPGPILDNLLNEEIYTHVGDLYFRLKEKI
jgi:hypothetical protein